VDPNITRSAITDVHRIIAPYVRATPICHLRGSDFGLSTSTLTLKLEQLQYSGSFKARGAFTNLLLRNVGAAGVVAASGGNHGVAVAYAARRLGHPARIFVPTISAPTKIERIRSYGADLCVGGHTYADALEASEAWAAQSGALQIHAFNQRETVLGQGTLALELASQAREIDTVLVAVGGGGLIGGTAAWYRRTVRVIGVEPRTAPTLTLALEAGRPVDAPASGIAADSLAPKQVGELTFAIARAWLDRVVLVEDHEISRAQRLLWDITRIVAEPGGAAAFAALTSGAYRPDADERVAVIVCGGNTDVVQFDRVDSMLRPAPSIG
jgi:threonine dehydratase